MRNFIAAIAAAIRAMASQTVTWVKVGGRWIARMVPSFGGPMPAPAMETAPVPASAPDADLVSVKAVAASMAAGLAPAPEQLSKLTDRQMAWLQALDQKMLCRIACADVEQIRAHVRGQSTIKGVLHADPEAVEAYVAAKAGIVADGSRTVAQELTARGIVL